MTELAHVTSDMPIDDALPRYESLVHMLFAAVEAVPEQTAVVFETRRISYAEFGRAVTGLARYLSGCGAGGGRVVVMMPNSIEMDVALLAAMAAGAQAAPVNPFFKPAELRKIMAGTDAAVILADAASADKARDIAAELGVGTVRILGPGGDVDLADFTGDPALDAAPSRLPAADDLALLIFTGGSTGVPKGVDHTHRGLIWSVLQHCSVWPVDFGAERFLNVAPMFHIWGLSYATWVPIFARSELIMIPKYEPDKVVRALSDHRVTIFAGGPAPIYMGLLTSPLFADADLTALKYCLSGGAPCPTDLHHTWRERTGCALLEGWGMTEGAPFCLNRLHGEHRLLSVGKPVPGTSIEVVDVDTGTRVLARGEPGEVRVHGPQLMRGYRNNPEETAAALRDGWMYTGDIGYLDADDFLFLVDRKKDMVLVGGYNVYPREVDEILFSHPAIREAATVGKPDARLGEVLVAFVVMQPGKRMSEEDFFAYCSESMVKYKRPVEVRFVDALPRTGTNKINRLALRELLERPPGRESSIR
jgi:long-chain acyl-CoA synthetase